MSKTCFVNTPSGAYAVGPWHHGPDEAWADADDAHDGTGRATIVVRRYSPGAGHQFRAYAIVPEHEMRGLV